MDKWVNELQWCAKKMTPCAKKKEPCAKKMSLGEKNLFVKN